MAGCTAGQQSDVLALLGGDAAAAATICSGGDVASLGAAGAVTRWTVGQLARTRDELSQVEHGLNVAFVLASAYQVFVMQLGFALFAAGVVRPKNVVAIFLKNVIDTCFAGIAFYLVGYAFAFGTRDGRSNGFIGSWDFALSATDGPQPNAWHLFLWNWSFCSAATTILSGSIAERASFLSYSIYSAFMPSWVYPVVAHWLWSNDGWLGAHNVPNRILGVGAIDYAGSGVVHLVGGMAALVGSVFTGPRVGRFGPSSGVSPQLARGSAAPHLYLMGTLLLWFGWYGFNPGSRLEISNVLSATIVSRTAVTTTLAACSGALSSLLLSYRIHRVWDLLSTCIGALAGLVAVTAGCSVIEPWAAIICGAIASLFYEAGEMLMEKFQVDDPVSAFPLHAMCGAWGLLFVGLLAQEDYVEQVYDVPAGHHRMGLLYGGHGQLLLCQVITVLAIGGWVALNMSALFWSMRAGGILRVAADSEAGGMDQLCGQLGQPGAVSVHSSKVATKSSAVLGAIELERRLNGNGNGNGHGGMDSPQQYNPPSVHLDGGDGRAYSTPMMLPPRAGAPSVSATLSEDHSSHFSAAPPVRPDDLVRPHHDTQPGMSQSA